MICDPGCEVLLTQKPIFYWGLSAKGGFPGWWPREPHNIMVSATSFWWPSRQKFVRRSLPRGRKGVFIDSGGYVAMNIYGDYPFRPDQYLGLVFHYRPDLAACLDYPCEPEIARGCHLETNQDRIEATIDHTEYLLGWTSQTRFLPVIQGYTINEYAYCIESLASRGLLRDYMAVGSMCRRWNISQLQETMLAIYHLICDAGITNPKLHWFGLKLQAISDPICRPMIHSCDSAAWSLAPGNTGRPKYAQSCEDEQWRFERYKQRLDKYQAIYS